MIPKRRRPTHPGEVLLKEFLIPTDTTQIDLARSMGVPVQRINTLIAGKRGITASTALLLAQQLGTSPEFWMNLQASVDLYDATQNLSAVSA